MSDETFIDPNYGYGYPDLNPVCTYHDLNPLSNHEILCISQRILYESGGEIPFKLNIFHSSEYGENAHGDPVRFNSYILASRKCIFIAIAGDSHVTQNFLGQLEPLLQDYIAKGMDNNVSTFVSYVEQNKPFPEDLNYAQILCVNYIQNYLRNYVYFKHHYPSYHREAFVSVANRSINYPSVEMLAKGTFEISHSHPFDKNFKGL